MLALRSVKSWATSGGLSMSQCRLKHVLPNLPFKYNELEPIISAEIMELHHVKHHGTYVNNLNNLEQQAKAALEAKNVDQFISLQNGIKFNGGGHINHSILWTILTPPGNNKSPSNEFLTALTSAFGSFDNFIRHMSNLAVGIEGSGWAWLGYNPMMSKLQLAKCQNQDPLQATTGLIPILGIDVWEHAYYLQYKNARAQYVSKLWDVINWTNVSKRYTDITKGNMHR